MTITVMTMMTIRTMMKTRKMTIIVMISTLAARSLEVYLGERMTITVVIMLRITIKTNKDNVDHDENDDKNFVNDDDSNNKTCTVAYLRAPVLSAAV